MSITAGIYPPQATPPTFGGDFSPTAVTAFNLAEAQYQAYVANTARIANYSARFAQFVPLYKLSELPASAAPAVPLGYVVEVSDGEADSLNIALVAQGAPVCAPLPLPDPPVALVQPGAANVIHVGKALGGGWFSTGQEDTFQSGKTTPPNTVSDDGVMGSFEKFAAPVGSGWYLKVA